jgi:AraC-like DNA-binding protein
MGVMPVSAAAGRAGDRVRPGVDFADLAVRLGWYDQAHFVNDFRSMLGSTPGEYSHQHDG